MENVFRLFGEIAIRNDEANRALDETAARAEGAGQQTESAFAGIGRAALTIGKAVVGAGVALGGAWIAAIESSREYRTEMGKLDTAFVTNGHSSEAATQTYRDLQAVLGDTDVSVEAANHLAVMTTNEKDLKTWTEICTGVFATFGDSLPIEGLTEASNETAKTGVVTGSLADALNWAGISEDEFNEKLAKCTTEQQRQDLIMNTLNGTYAKASEQYKTTNKDVMEANRAQERLTNAFAELGRVGEPILTAIKNGVAKMVSAAVPKLESLIKKVKDAKKWMQDNKDTVDAWKAAIIAVTVSVGSFLLVLKWSAIMGAATKAVKATRAAILLFNTALRANPIGLVVSLIAGLVAAFVYLWNNNKGFRDFWINLWNKIKSVTSSVISAVKSKFNDFKAAFGTVKTVFNNIQKTVSEKMNSARDKVRDAIAKIKGFFNFKWSLPKLKMPTFSLKGKFSLNPPSVPKIGIKWNAEGGILTKPTIFGQVGNTLMGGGEAGHEAILPLDRLSAFVRDAVRAENENIGRILIEQNERMMDFLRRTIPHDVTLDKAVLVGALIPAVDTGLADRYMHVTRGNVR